MKSGNLRFGRDLPVFVGDEEKVSGLDRALGGIGILTDVRRHFACSDIPAQYCPKCKKLTIETGIAK